ncbi:MAG: MBOAT family protein [Anaerolineae bacterium]|nr:MBOAT family protein [Anaerolineae bacterium]
MSFHHPFFLLIFFPIFLIITALPWKKARDILILILSISFVYWLEPQAFPLVLLMLVVTYFIGRGISRAIEVEGKPKAWMWSGVGLHLAVLIALKLSVVLDVFPSMPAGYSFFSFIAMAYLLDIHKRQIPAEKNFFHFTHFLLFFPKLLAGPIVRWKQVAADDESPLVSLSEKQAGLRRFIVGLAKKVLIANQLGTILDGGIFNQPTPQITTATAWVLLFFYAIQLYYDFAGYTDMAIGLAKMVGISLPENFDQPYTSRSITEFWRRWHMTLSAWFRDYVFIPLEWRRRKLKWLKQFMNALIVFLLTGLWHGFTVNFVIWGLLHGAATAVENTKTLGKQMKSWKPIWQRVYTLLVILIGWVFFRSPSFDYALHWLKALFGFGTRVNMVGYSVLPHIGSTTWLAFLLGVLLCFPVGEWVRWLLAKESKYEGGAEIGLHFAYLSVFLVSLTVLFTSSYLPTIYGNF